MAPHISLPERVAGTIRDHRMFASGTPILVGVSGGADSVALVRILSELRSTARAPELAVAHVNHGWRGAASDADEEFVRALAGRLRLPIFVRTIRGDGVGGGTGPGLEARARAQRRTFFDETRRREGFGPTAVAHTREDRAETFFLNLMRGAGGGGLIAMRPAAGGVIRPLIESGRAEIEAYLEQIGQDWRQDETNRDRRFARNRVRHDLFPALYRDFNPRLSDALLRTIDILEKEDEWMDRLVAEWLAGRVSHDGADMVLEIAGLASEPVARVRRVLRCALGMAGSPMRDIGFHHIERLRSLLEEGKSGRRIELPGAIRVERSFGTLRFCPDDEPIPGYAYRLAVPGRIEVPEIGRVFEARRVRPEVVQTDKPNGDRVFVDGESLGRYVKIRNWQNGDFYNPNGLAASKLKALFQQGRIPRGRRRLWPVVVADSAIVWVASFPVSRDFVPTGRSRSVVEFEASQPSG